MKIFDEDGNCLGEGNEVFDSEGNLVGHLFDSTKERAQEVYKDSPLLGILFLLFIAPGWTLLGLLFIGLYKLIKLLFRLLIKLLIIVFKGVWWLIRLPFFLIFKHECPEF